MLSRYLFIALCVTASLLLGACGSDDAEEQLARQKDRPVEDLYHDAASLMSEGNYKKAAEAFNEVDRQHPYSDWAVKAQLMSAYASYEANEYDKAITGLDRFIALYPGHENVAYAYYLKAMSYYEQISDVRRDQEMTEKALAALADVAERYPDSNYGRDAKLKIDLTRDHLAGKEMEIARFYMRQKFYPAAINRFMAVLRDYQTTTHVPEALHRLVEAYLALGLKKEAQAAGAVLGHNYPGSDWYQDSYRLLVGENLTPDPQADTSWWKRTWNKVF